MTTRQAILARAGFTEEVMAAITKEAVSVLVDALRATKRTPHTYKGEVISVSEEVDHSVRSKASERILTVFGVTAQPHNVKQEIVVEKTEALSLVLNMGDGTTLSLGAPSNTPRPDDEPIDVTPHPETNHS